MEFPQMQRTKLNRINPIECREEKIDVRNDFIGLSE